MKRLAAWALTLATLLTLALPAGAVAIDTGKLPKAQLGVYGEHLYMLGKPIDPQAYIYNMLYDAIKDKNPETIDLSWEATPLHASTYLRDEAMLALNLDHPELNLGKYQIAEWKAELKEAYIATFTFSLARGPVPDTSANLAAATAAVSAAAGSYAKAKAAFDWLMDNAAGGGGATAEDAFTGKNANYVGLTMAFKQLMDGDEDGVEVPCVLGRNGLSIWAYVRMDDGKYYVVDFKKAVGAPEPTRWFLCGDDMYTNNESFPEYMRQISKGSGLNGKVESRAYLSEDMVTVTITDSEFGSVEVFYGDAKLTSGSTVPAGANLKVKAIPEETYEVFLNSRYEATRVKNVFEVVNLRDNIVVEAQFNQSYQPPDPRFTVLPTEHGSVKLISQIEGHAPEILPGRINIVPKDSTLTVELIPDLGYQIKNLQADPYDMIDYESMTWVKSGAYTFWPSNKTPSGSNVDFDLEENTKLTCGPTGYIETVYDVDFTANFEPIPDGEKVTVHTVLSGNGTVLVEQKDGEQFVPLLENGQAIKGTDLKIILAPAPGYQVENVTIAPVATEVTVNQEYALNSVVQDVTLTATFTPIPVTGVTLNKSALSLKTGASETLTAAVSPADAANKTVTWTSSAPAVAEVDAVGKVTAKSAGSAIITVTTADGAKTDICTVTVTAADSGGNGGGGGAPAPKPTETEGSVSVKPSDLQKALKEAAQAGDKTVVLTPGVSKETDGTVAVDLPKIVMSELAKTPDAALRLDLPAASVTLPGSALTALGSGDTRITLTQKDGAVTLSVTSGGEAVDKLPLTLTLPGQNYGPGWVAVAGEAVVRKSAPGPGGMTVPLSGPGTVTMEDRGKTFPDTEAHWAAGAVAFVTARNLFGGVSGSSFAPDIPMNRAMLAAVFHRLENAPAGQAAAGFPDVTDPEAYYYDAVAWAWSAGIVSGTGTGFAPNDPVSREQIAVVLRNYARWLGHDVTPAGDLAAFPDAADASPWAADALAWAVGEGLLTGADGGALAPQSTATRAQVAVLLQRLIASL